MSEFRIRYEPVYESGKTEIAPGLELYNQVWVRAFGYHGYNVHLHVQLENERLGVSDMRVEQRPGGPPVTGEALRSIVVAQFVRRSVRASINEQLPFDEPEARVANGILRTEDRDRMKEAGPVTETLRAVSQIYRFALAAGDAPTKAVQEVFEVPRYTADRWVAKAREREFLGPAEGPGKAGA
ncbi:hypothetical protein DFQ14_12228 [Halopolyspora algeriensis]|uniref:Uncharacterized protein n=1 Tax=Halopolyspora algeriensis TaxID=1500506 RepID=A0A368VE24_9ACTN|nr:hypothetical protein [Halopolyspora algeriensis]RCW38485.1 hypothetical protein DFQ14_12228 [Halopolyspora algeriensis]TQM42633.1 hypothetical protein FHU43_4272 [Halopolyspora algeriensis]